MIKSYYFLTKPGIIFGNLITAIAGFFLAAKGDVYYPFLLVVLLGLSLVVGSACVFNNYIDRDTDKRMARTKNRALARGTIQAKHALILAIFLGVLGFFVLGFFANSLSAFMAFLGFSLYVLVYSIWKYHTVHATFLGSLSGAIPPVVGYTAVANHVDIGAILLFAIVVFWQMPHFYAIALYRLSDYQKANIPLLPVLKGAKITKIYILIYTTLFGIASALLFFMGFGGYLYAAIAFLLTLSWLYLAIRGFWCKNDTAWAYRMFRFSLLVIVVLCLGITIDASLIV